MSSRRLTASEKQAVVALYRQSGENATELADRFGVSNSTIGRILKTAIPEEEFDALLQAKRRGFIEDTIDIPEVTPPPVLPESPPTTTKPRISRVKDIVKPAPLVELEPEIVEPAPPVPISSSKPLPKKKIISSRSAPAPEPIEDDEFDEDEDELTVPPTMDAAEFQDVAAELSHAPRLLDEDEDDDDDFDEEDDDGDDGDDRDLPAIHLEAQAIITVRPFREAALPRVCYLVIDRSAELVAPPLREFAELGSLSAQEADIKTLPVFDNHRVAKRFSNSRTHRVIKVPDSQIVNKTVQYLVAKGITRMLLDGQVYSLN
ncbi:MAG: transposase [Alkalinema sp. RU_4_3]|nr:transposase [Alkalinema sp. RU_4_3]